MFFIVSKLVWFLIQPLVMIAVIAIAGVVLGIAGFRSLAASCYLAAGLLYAVVMFTPLGLLMVGFLEDRFPRPPPPASVTGIVVLGGSFDTRVAKARGEAEISDAGDRITGAMALARKYPDAKVVFTGGVAAVFEDDIPEVDVAKQIFTALGLPPERLVLEGQARNTEENARYTKALVDPKPGETWLLVTSAFHMPRSVGCFRAAGFDVVPYPVDYRTPGGAALWRPAWADVSRNADKVQLAVREYVGLLAYRLTGMTGELFPSPAPVPPTRASSSAAGKASL